MTPQPSVTLTPTQILAARWDPACPVCEPHWPCTLHRQPTETKEQQR